MNVGRNAEELHIIIVVEMQTQQMSNIRKETLGAKFPVFVYCDISGAQWATELL